MIWSITIASIFTPLSAGIILMNLEAASDMQTDKMMYFQLI
jgi:hypothetical protein